MVRQTICSNYDNFLKLFDWHLTLLNRFILRTQFIRDGVHKNFENKLRH